MFIIQPLFGLQNSMVQLLEMALINRMDKTPDVLQPCSVDSLVDLLPSVTRSSCGNDLDNYIKCGPQGNSLAHKN